MDIVAEIKEAAEPKVASRPPRTPINYADDVIEVFEPSYESDLNTNGGDVDDELLKRMKRVTFRDDVKSDAVEYVKPPPVRFSVWHWPPMPRAMTDIPEPEPPAKRKHFRGIRKFFSRLMGKPPKHRIPKKLRPQLKEILVY